MDYFAPGTTSLPTAGCYLFTKKNNMCKDIKVSGPSVGVEEIIFISW